MICFYYEILFIMHKKIVIHVDTAMTSIHICNCNYTMHYSFIIFSTMHWIWLNNGEMCQDKRFA